MSLYIGQHAPLIWFGIVLGVFRFGADSIVTHTCSRCIFPSEFAIVFKLENKDKFGIITSILQIDSPSLFQGLLVTTMIHDKYVFHKRNYITKVARGP